MASPEERKFLGSASRTIGARGDRAEALEKFQMRIEEATRRTAGGVLAAGLAATALPDRMAQLLGFYQYPRCAHEPRSVDTPKTSRLSLAAVEERAQPLKELADEASRSSRLQLRPVSDRFWRMSRHVSVQRALRDHEFRALGMPRLYVAR